MFTLFNVVSSDGFIADQDGREDFIPEELWPNFLDLCMHYGAIVMGRKTYDALQKYPDALLDPFESLEIPKIVISADDAFQPKSGYSVLHSPAEALSRFPNALVSSGPILNTALLRAHMVGRVIQHELPVAIGRGILPFDPECVTLIPEQNVPEPRGATVRYFTAWSK